MNDTEIARPWKRARITSNLTDEEIQQKRNVDRKAQRAFRQRTKKCIINLERRLAELEESSSQKETYLQQQLQELQERNNGLVQCLEDINALAGGTLSIHINTLGSRDSSGA
jgi:predicted metal-dependent hydrolase